MCVCVCVFGFVFHMVSFYFGFFLCLMFRRVFKGLMFRPFFKGLLPGLVSSLTHFLGCGFHFLFICHRSLFRSMFLPGFIIFSFCVLEMFFSGLVLMFETFWASCLGCKVLAFRFVLGITVHLTYMVVATSIIFSLKWRDHI